MARARHGRLRRLDAGDPDQAKAYLNRQLATYPKGPWAAGSLYNSGMLYTDLARISRSEADKKSAAEAFDQLQKKFPESSYRDRASAELLPQWDLDRRVKKLDEYKRVQSVQAIVLVDTEMPRMTVHLRDGTGGCAARPVRPAAPTARRRPVSTTERMSA